MIPKNKNLYLSKCLYPVSVIHFFTTETLGLKSEKKNATISTVIQGSGVRWIDRVLELQLSSNISLSYVAH